jgi:uncharacterized protein
MDQDNVQVILEREPKVKNPVLIEGFPGIGLVGNIASQYIVHELNMTYLGAMSSKQAEKELVVITADIPIHPLASYDIGKEIVSWAESINAKEMVCLAGITVMSEEHRVFGAASTKEMLERLKDKAEVFELGTITGITGSIMNECRIRKMPAICLLGETASAEPDPRAAISAVETLNKIYDLGVSTTKLAEQAEQIELQMHQLSQQLKAATPEEQQMPKEFPMYG